MKELLFISILSVFILFPLAGEDINTDEADAPNENEVVKYDISGFALEISFLNYFSTGLGYKWGTGTSFRPHFFARDFGFFLEYKTKDELHFRVYYDLYGGSAAMLLGASGIFASNFRKIAGGLAPHIGMGFPGMKLFYRYNFYTSKSFNCHEVVFVFSAPGFDEKRKK